MIAINFLDGLLGRLYGHWQCPFAKSEVAVRADSFACKETSELDRLLQRNQSGGFTSGTQLYDYLKAHKCIGLTAGRARVHSTQVQYVCIYDSKDNKSAIYPCMDRTRYAVAMIQSVVSRGRVHIYEQRNRGRSLRCCQPGSDSGRGADCPTLLAETGPGVRLKE